MRADVEAVVPPGMQDRETAREVRGEREAGCALGNVSDPALSDSIARLEQGRLFACRVLGKQCDVRGGKRWVWVYRSSRRARQEKVVDGSKGEVKKRLTEPHHPQYALLSIHELHV